jgi:hypothetical protein
MKLGGNVTGGQPGRGVTQNASAGPIIPEERHAIRLFFDA